MRSPVRLPILMLAYHEVIRCGHFLADFAEVFFSFERSFAGERHFPLVEEALDVMMLSFYKKFTEHFLGLGFQL